MGEAAGHFSSSYSISDLAEGGLNAWVPAVHFEDLDSFWLLASA